MYTYILDRLATFHQINNVELYLQGLQPYVKSLRQSYRLRYVSVDYSGSNVQAAYLLAYYPQYAEITHKVLCDLAQNYLHPYFAGRRELQACFFGAGPAPETVGWLRSLNCNYSTAKHAVAHTYDIAADTWGRSREITEYVASQLFLTLGFTLNGNSLNLCQKHALSAIREVIQICRLFVIQNCLNEFVASPKIFIQNLDFIIT